MILTASEMAGRTSMPETAVEFLEGVSVTIVPIYGVPSVGMQYSSTLRACWSHCF